MALSGGAGALLAAELAAPLLLLCGLCCWPDDRSDTSSTGNHPQKPVVAKGRRRSSETAARRGGSATSLHLPSTSGRGPPAHRSHEEIRPPPPGSFPAPDPALRRSAPSVIDEVLHRRDWERSSKELYIPLRPDAAEGAPAPPAPPTPPSPPASPSPPAPDRPPCKKHHTNIKSSRNRTPKEHRQDDVKDTDENETNSYIGETRTEDAGTSRETLELLVTPDDAEEKIRSVYKAKDAKQSFNESVKYKERPGCRVLAVDIDLDLEYVDQEYADQGSADQKYEQLEYADQEWDRSGAARRDRSPAALSDNDFYPPSSVEAVGWEGGACYLPRAGGVQRARLACNARARHASDGDILAPPGRPESSAFSESDLELELEPGVVGGGGGGGGGGGDEPPPPYEQLSRRKETAI